MAATLLLDISKWDLVLDAGGNIALATEPYSLAQDAASAIKTFLGECWFDTTIGVPYSQILGQNPPIPLLRARMVQAAETVSDVASAQCFISGISERAVAGQVQVTSAATGEVSVASFTAISPQGVT